MTSTLKLLARPLSGALGARVDGVDLSAPLGEETVAEVRALLDRYLVLFFADQGVGDDAQLALSSQFGVPYVHPIARTLGRVTALVEHIVDSVEHPPYQDRWHTDVSWDPFPPVYGFLRAEELPSRGGDTIWASMYAAYDALSPLMQHLVEPLVAVHDMGSMRAFIEKAGAEAVARTREQFPGAEHPVVGVHPATGRRYLNVNREFTDRIVGLHPEESAALLGVLVQHAANPNLQYRHSWTRGEVAIWDERCTQHFAVADYLPERRQMARVVVGAFGALKTQL
jgi:taurine dioxygenase